MNRIFRDRAAMTALLLALLSLILLGGVTYAWFTTSSGLASTSRATAHTADGDLKLQVCENVAFLGDTDQTDIPQVNSTDPDALMPVSTDDLNSFVCCPVTDNGMATRFEAVTGEEGYFHGRFYIRALGGDSDGDGTVNVYIDGSETDTPLFREIEGRLLNAARLGLRISAGTEMQSVILSLSDVGNGAGSGMNTQVDGVTQPEGIVLHSTGQSHVTPVADPSVFWKERAMDEDWMLPEFPLFQLRCGVIYTVDLFFYLEGCDPDCTNIISANMAEIMLRFYGTMS